MTETIIFILGLIIGSFLNAVIFRLWKNESFVGGRSRCPHCHHELAAIDLIPLLSFILLGGHCRYCKKSISWQYPLVELATALIFVWYYNHFGLNLTLAFNLVFASLFIVIAVFDLKHYLILDKVLILGLFLSLIYLFITDGLASGLIAALIASGFFGVQYLLSSGRWIGLGDVKLGLLLGMVAGFPNILAVLFLAYMLGALVGVLLIATGKKHLSSQLPFGTFLGISAIIMLPKATEFISWYKDLVNL